VASDDPVAAEAKRAELAVAEAKMNRRTEEVSNYLALQILFEPRDGLLRQFFEYTCSTVIDEEGRMLTAEREQAQYG
jgi:hypothetical protein